jgi:Uma2 family endonuclease
MSPSPTLWHQKLIVEFVVQIGVACAHQPGLTCFPSTDLRLGANRVYRPDLSVYRPGRLKGIPERLENPPDLIIEILSPGTKALDLITKRDDYEMFGVGEYWVLNPTHGGIRRWVRDGTTLQERSFSGDSLASIAIPGLTIETGPLRPRPS